MSGSERGGVAEWFRRRSHDLEPDLQNRIQVRRGYPRLSTDLESSVAGLFFAGLPAGGTFGPVMRFVCGTEFASPRIARAAARAVSHAA